MYIKLVALHLVLIIGMRMGLSASEPSDSSASSYEVQQLLADGITSWVFLDSADEAECRQLVNHLRALCDVNVAELESYIQDAVTEAHKYPRGRQIAMYGNIFVLLRIYFDIPARVPSSKGHARGGWLPEDWKNSEGYNVAWPISTDEYGKQHIVGFNGGLNGLAYNPISDLRYLKANFPPRPSVIGDNQ